MRFAYPPYGFSLGEPRKLAAQPRPRGGGYTALIDNRLDPVMNRQLYLAAYDVADPRRLRHALELVKGHATGGQKSAYECWLTVSERAALLADMALMLEEAEDSFLLIGLDPRAHVYTLGAGEAPHDTRLFYIQ